MVKTIGNPASWAASWFVGAAEYVTESVEAIAGEDVRDPVVNRISTADIRASLRRGMDDFVAARDDVIFIVLVYPLIGLALATLSTSATLVPLLFPVAAGFALLGPLAAVGLYEISRRRELGQPVSWSAAFSVIRSPNFGAVVVLGFYLVTLFLVWLMVAWGVYAVTMGPESPASTYQFFHDVFLTGPGWAMIVLGMAVGFVFALAALVASVVSFPLVIDRHVSVAKAVATSIELFRKNPREIGLWGLIVAVGLFLGSIPFFVGLIFVLPVLGHATWHLYRRAIS